MKPEKPSPTNPFKGAFLRYLKNRTAWDWLVGLIVAVSLVFAALYTGHGMYVLAKATLAQVLLDKAWADTLARNEARKPWSWLDSRPVALISVPRLGERAVALDGASGQALAFGPAHVNGTAQPGAEGFAVYAAHRDTHFAFMNRLTVGDVVAVTDRTGKRFEYEVRGFRVARWDSSGLDPALPGQHLALVTCWPLDSVTFGPLRYIAEATLMTPVRKADIGEHAGRAISGDY
ncbi:MAG: class GN sortase, partial [Fimbriimonadaceae bacterium]|nr:class GN sortase [Alphaproteobacteria bacterium]